MISYKKLINQGKGNEKYDSEILTTENDTFSKEYDTVCTNSQHKIINSIKEQYI